MKQLQMFLVGYFVGMVVTIFVMAILTAASNDDDWNRRD